MDNPVFEIVSDKPMLLGECPLWHPKESVLYWIDIAGLAIHRYNPIIKEFYSWNLPSEPGCIAWCEDGCLLVAMRTGIAILDTKSGSLLPIASAPYDPLKFRFNDGRCDAAGRLLTGSLVDARDAASGRLYSFEKGLIRDLAIAVTVSNGVAFNLDYTTLFHADTSAHTIMQYDYDLSTGLPSNRRLFQQFSDVKDKDYGGRPDGAAVDSEGAYWVAMYEGGKILRFATDGTLLNVMKVPFMCPTMIAFGGADLRTLFITSARQKRTDTEIDRLPLTGYVISTRVDIPGKPEYPYLR
jgi:sugar lactone lactonase YvrE